MNPARRLLAGLFVFVMAGVVGVAGYMLIEDQNFLDAFYLTIITISTVGFREPAGGFSNAGQLFTIGLVIAGVGSVLYTASQSIELGVEAFLGGDRQRRRMERHIAGLRDHVILCGFGRVGRNVWDALREGRPDVERVVIEADPDRADRAREIGAIVVEGDATHDDTLMAAGVDRADTLIASVRNDSDNLVIVLSARSRRPDLRIIARATEAESERKLVMAGADRVVAPQLVGAHRMAALAVQPDVAEFIDLIVQGRVVEFRVEQFDVSDASPVVGRSLRDTDLRRETGTLVLAVEENGRLLVNPSAEFVLRSGQVLYGIGTQEQVDHLRRLVCEPD